MAQTHDYETTPVRGDALDDTMVLVGESGGLSAVYDVGSSPFAAGLVAVRTEHGMLHLDPEKEYEVLVA